MFPRHFSLSCDRRRACCGIQQRGPFFSEVLAFNVKMEETSEGQRELLFLFIKWCYRDGKFVPYTLQQKAILARPVLRLVQENFEPQQEAFSVSRHGGFCSSRVPGMRLLGASFLCNSKSFTHTTEELSPLLHQPGTQVTQFSSLMVGGSSLGLALMKLENQIWEKSSLSVHAHTHMHFMSPQHRDHNQTQSLGCEWDQRGQVHSHKLHHGVCVNIWYSSSFRTSCGIPSSLFAGKNSNLLRFYFFRKKSFSA